MLTYLLNFMFGVALAAPIAVDRKLINGSPVPDGTYPEVVYIAAGNGRCTATVVGPRVIMTAGHCVADGGEIRDANFVMGQKVFTAKCTQHPNYRTTQLQDDIALCKTDRVIEDLAYATVQAVVPLIGERVTLMGYGCTHAPGNGGNDGVLRYGFASISKLPRPDYHWYNTNADTTLCFGDSGGPNFKAETHEIYGINSRGDMRTLSMFTALVAVRPFLADYVTAQNVEICGVNKKCVMTKPPPEKCPVYRRLLDYAQGRYDRCVQRKTSF